MNGTSLDEKNNEKKINYFLKFETENLRVVYSVISDFLGKNIIEIIYGDYEMTGGNKFPGNMKISIASKGINLSCTMKMERVLVNTDFGINYIVNPKYKRIDW
jgi:hypothetical protein